MPDRQPRPPLGHADRPDTASHATTLLNRLAPAGWRLAPAGWPRLGLAPAGWHGNVGTVTSFRQPGTVLTDRFFAVPLDHRRPDGEQIEVFAREVVAAGQADADLPWLLFLQGGPGFGAQRPVGRESWLDRALQDYRVLLLDQRGTGRSSPANRKTLARLGARPRPTT